MTPHYEGCLGDRQLGVGAVDVQAPNIESGVIQAQIDAVDRAIDDEKKVVPK
jgi:5-methyltetrahydropteroyltriglutamate--homocysteine methyltransferase